MSASSPRAWQFSQLWRSVLFWPYVAACAVTASVERTDPDADAPAPAKATRQAPCGRELEERLERTDGDLPPRILGTLPFAEITRNSWWGLGTFHLARYRQAPSELHVLDMFALDSPIHASDVLLADTRRLFGNAFPERVVHRHVNNSPTLEILENHGLQGRDATLTPSDDAFELLLRTCRTNGNVTRRFLEAAGTLDPDHTYSITSITVRWSDWMTGRPKKRPDISFELERVSAPSTQTCPSTNQTGATPSSGAGVDLG